MLICHNKFKKLITIALHVQGTRLCTCTRVHIRCCLILFHHCRDVFCAGRVPEEDLRRTMKACGGSVQTSVSKLTDDVLGSCENFEEQQIGGER